jgi:hypothetical protein
MPQAVVALEAAAVLARGPSGKAIAWVSRDPRPLAALWPLALVLDPHASPGLPPAHPGWHGLAAAGGGAASGPRTPARWRGRELVSCAARQGGPKAMGPFG